MRKRFSILLMVGVLVSGVGMSAQAPPATRPGIPPAPIEAQPPSGPVPTTLRMDGTIGKFDAAASTLSLTTSNGTVRLPLAANARIRQGWRRIDAMELEKLAGHYVTIRYSESGGIKTVESIHVFGKNERGER